MSLVTDLPTSSTSPAATRPSTGCLGLLNPSATAITGRRRGGTTNARTMQSLAVTAEATLRMSTSLLEGTGFGSSLISRTSGGPYLVQTAALIAYLNLSRPSRMRSSPNSNSFE